MTPLGPLLFSLATFDLISTIKSEFAVFYLDDGTLGGSIECIKSDLATLEVASHKVGFKLNHCKSELICGNDNTRNQLLSSFPSLHITNPEDATLLGSPIGGIGSLNSTLAATIDNLQHLGERVKLLQAHNALCLLRNAFTMPKFLYVLRTAPCFQSHLLSEFNKVQRSLLKSICNIHLDVHSWKQASLPINAGGLGIRSAVMLAPSAFLASAAGSVSLSLAILPQGFTSVNRSLTSEALTHWRTLAPSSAEVPSGTTASQQKAWDTLLVHSCFSSLIQNVEPRQKAHLLAAHQKESEAWLSAPPVSVLGLRMDNDSI